MIVTDNKRAVAPHVCALVDALGGLLDFDFVSYDPAFARDLLALGARKEPRESMRGVRYADISIAVGSGSVRACGARWRTARRRRRRWRDADGRCRVSCCTTDAHEAIKRDAAAWSALPSLGVHTFDFGDGDPPVRVEMRNCGRCNSTLAIELPADMPSAA